MPTLLARGTITISKMDDVYEIKLAPWTVSIPSNSDGSNSVLSSAKTRLIVNKDAVLISTVITSLITKNCTATFLGNEVSITSVSADSGEVEINFNVEDQTRSAVFSWTKAKQGNAGTDAYTVVLDNEAHSIPATSSGIVTLAELDKATSGIRAWKGSTELTAVAANAFPVIGQYRYNITSSVGCTAVRVDNTRFKLSAMTADSARVDVRIWVEGKQYLDKVMTVTKSKAGSDGAAGNEGPSLTGGGIYHNGETYIGLATRVDVVDFNGDWFKAKTTAGTFSGIAPTGHPQSSAKWEPFGAQFKSVATEVSFMVKSTIKNLIAEEIATSIHPGRGTWNENGNGLIELRWPNGVVAMKLGLIEGTPSIVFQNELGDKTWSADPVNRIVYIDNVPATSIPYQVYEFGNVNLVTDRAYLLSLLNSDACKIETAEGFNVNFQPTYLTTIWKYDAGVNVNSDYNKQFNGFHYNDFMDEEQPDPVTGFMSFKEGSFMAPTTPTGDWRLRMVDLDNNGRVTSEQELDNIPYTTFSNYCGA